MEIVAPMKILNQKKEWEPWKSDHEVKVQWKRENDLWRIYQTTPSDINKLSWQNEKAK